MKIAPSILDANFQSLQTEIDSIKNADKIHLDIMDGNYVPPISFGANILSQLNFPIPTEVHLMTAKPAEQFEGFINLGVKIITFQREVVSHSKTLELLKFLKNNNIGAGICLDLDTPVTEISQEILQLADQILLMSVKAGYGGQSFQPSVMDKVKALRAQNFPGEIEIDGGINDQTIQQLSMVDSVVVGSFLMKSPIENRPKLITNLQSF
jgi:ribulose-phosphate 3-epimerase